MLHGWRSIRYIQSWQSSLPLITLPRIKLALCLLHVGVDDVDKCWFQASTTNEESINVRHLCKLVAVLLVHTPAIDDPRAVSSFLRHFLAQPRADGGMDFLCLFWTASVSFNIRTCDTYRYLRPCQSQWPRSAHTRSRPCPNHLCQSRCSRHSVA